jgi:hypothetical protein
MKIANDKYYTPVDLSKRLIEKTFDIIGRDNITEIIEPSAGGGSFSGQIANCIAYDIEPEGENIMQANFLELNMMYKTGRLFIGNPPFGVRNSLAYKFYNKCALLGDYIAFVLPISCLDNDIKMYKFDLVYSEDLGLACYSGRDLHCCFNIYKRPVGGANERPDYKLNEIQIVERRRVNGEYATGHNACIEPNFCYSMCNWGSGIGKRPNYIGEFAQEVYFYCDNERIREEMYKLLSFDAIQSYVKSISSKKISVMKLYKYLYENIDGLTLKNPRIKTNNKIL